MRSAICRRAGELVLGRAALPEVGPGEVRIRIRSCGICGSDLHWYQGHAPPPAVCPGHEIAGAIEATGPGVEGLTPGDRVVVEGLRSCGLCEHCRRGETQRCADRSLLGRDVPGGFADFAVTAARHVVRIPDALSDLVACLAEPLAVAVHAARVADLRAGQRVLVLGAGTVGLLCAAVARRAGTEVAITTRHGHQAEAAERVGARAVPAEAPEQAAFSAGADVVLETVGGVATTLDTALAFVRPGGAVAVLGVFVDPVRIDALSLMNDEIRLLGCMAYGRSGPRADFAVAIEILQECGEAWADALVTHHFALAEVDRAFQVASDKRSGAIKVLVEPAG